MWMKLNFPEQKKAKLMGHSICPGVQKGVNVDNQNILKHMKRIGLSFNQERDSKTTGFLQVKRP